MTPIIDTGKTLVSRSLYRNNKPVSIIKIYDTVNNCIKKTGLQCFASRKPLCFMIFLAFAGKENFSYCTVPVACRTVLFIHNGTTLFPAEQHPAN